ncbi:MAG: hypothetical protein M0P32_06975 [Bacteroidales bacterium]|jgi:hypothetical protein|nr:hypothetical protein [Bacteroidales bacterium]MDY0388870.1 hypothetical protein [Methanolobus sp.]
MTRYYIDLKEYAETADISEVSNETLKEVIKDFLLEAQNRALTIPAVVKSLPTDECVEQWWAEGQDQQKGFWQEAPYRTNGDVIEEIKTALKYFIETWQR